MRPSVTIPFIALLELLSGGQLREILLDKGCLIPVAIHNWAAEYPYAPQVTARMAYSENRVVVMFDVIEEHLKAVELNDNGKVWEDSCVEFFVANPIGEGYFNFECNAIGTLLAAYRTSRESADHFSAEQLSKIVRYGSLKREKIDVLGQNHWWVAISIPFELLGLKTAPDKIRANLYKCGDNLSQPHYLSWSAIELEKPNFHCPDFFGEIIFDTND